MKDYIRVLGAADWQQAYMLDHSAYTVSDQILVDANPAVVHHLFMNGVEPLDVRQVFFTHMHADHMLGLAPLLLYWRAKFGRYDGLTIYGPAETVHDAVQAAINYATFRAPGDSTDVCGRPNVIGLQEGDNVELAGYAVAVGAADHAVPARAYRFRSKATGESVCFSGDTRYRQALIDFYAGASLLVHEASAGAKPVGPNNEISRHSSVFDAVRAAEEAKVKRLLLTHMRDMHRENALNLAKTLTQIPVAVATPYEKIEF